MWTVVGQEYRILSKGEPRLRMRLKHDCVPQYQRVLVLPADKESVARMVEQVAAAILRDWEPWAKDFECIRDKASQNARAALRSLGIADKGDYPITRLRP